jgi:hypothetical protein
MAGGLTGQRLDLAGESRGEPFSLAAPGIVTGEVAAARIGPQTLVVWETEAGLVHGVLECR